MTKYYTNKPDFSGDPTYPLVSSDSYFKSMSSIMDDIEAAGKVVTDEGVEDLYSQTGEASLGTTKDSTTFDKSLKRIYNMLTSAKKIHSDIMQNIDSKFTKGMDEAFTTLNNVNSSSKPYKSKYTKKTVSKKVLAGYKADGNAVYIDSTEVKSYNLSEILDGKASPLQAAKDVYDDRIKAVKEMMAKKDQLSDEQIKAIEGKSAEEIVAVRYPGQLPDYQRLKASRYYEENKESLQYLDIGLKTLAVLSMIGGAALAPATGGTSLTATYAGGTYLAADGAYSAIEGHSFITGTQLTTEERIWAGIDSVVTIASMGSAAYLTKLAKSGAEGSTLLKNLAMAGKHADDANDVTKVIYSFATGQDPNAALQNLVFGQVMGLGMNSAGNYIGKKFGAPSVDVPGTKPSHLDVPLQGKQIPKLDPDSVRFNSRQDLHLKASPADGTLAKLKNHPAVSLDVPKVKNNVFEPNFANYKEFSTTKIDDFKTNFKDVETKITVETRNAAGEIQRIQLKAVGVDETGKIRIQDYTTAKGGLSVKRQDILDNLSKYGGTIVGEGKGRFVGGTKIEPGTRIDVISKQTDSFTIDKVSSFDKVKQYTSELYKTDLSLEEKVQKLQKYFTELDDKVDINVPSDAQYVKSFEDGWISYDWPERLGFKKGTVRPITRTSGLPERWDRFGHMGGRNFSDIPSGGPYTHSQRSIPYVENLKTYHNGNFKTDSYFDKIDAISEGDIKTFNRILREEGIEAVSQDQFLELSDKYRKYISDTSTSLSMSSDDIKYGVHGKAAEWGDMSGGAEQIVTPFGGIDMLNMGIMEEF